MGELVSISNDQPQIVGVESDMPSAVGLAGCLGTGTKYSWGIGACGACSVLRRPIGSVVRRGVELDTRRRRDHDRRAQR